MNSRPKYMLGLMTSGSRAAIKKYRCSVKFDFQINNADFLKYKYVIYIKFKLSWAPCLFFCFCIYRLYF